MNISPKFLWLLLVLPFIILPRPVGNLPARPDGVNVQPAPVKKTNLVRYPYPSDLPQTLLGLQAIREEFGKAQDLIRDVYSRFLGDAYQLEIISLGVVFASLLLLIFLLTVGIRKLTKTRLDLRNLNAHLEDQVRARTQELCSANLALSTEVTERKQADMRLAHLAAIVESSDAAIIGKTLDGIITSWNKGAEHLYGYTPAEVIGQSISILLPPGREDDFPRILNLIKQGEPLRPFETQRCTKAGRVVDVSLSISPIQSAAGELLGAATIARDITERKQAEMALRESNLRLQLALDVTQIGIHEWDIQANRLIWDDRMRALWELAPGVPITLERFRQGIHPDDLARVEASIQQLRTEASDEKYWIEYRVIGLQTGVERWLELYGQIHFTDGRPARFLGTAIDITERKRIEQAEGEQRAMAEALRDTAAALNSTLQYDEVLDRILENVGRVVSHDADAMGLLLLGPDRQFARLTRYRSRQAPLYSLGVEEIAYKVADTRNLREVLATGAPVIIADTSTDNGWISTPWSKWIRTNLIVPIAVKGEIIGFLSLDSAKPHAFNTSDAERLSAFVNQAAIAIENARLYTEIHELAITDPLTGLINRRGLFQIGEREVERASRFQHPLSAVMFDIDHFKRVNDTYGHSVGDQVLRALADCCHSQIRKVDILARYGGEEFILLLPETNLESAIQTAERLRRSIEQIGVETAANPGAVVTKVQVTVSLGVVGFTAKTPNLASLITQADLTLYSAKQAGRNRVAVG